jgi:hypothetical protein
MPSRFSVLAIDHINGAMAGILHQRLYAWSHQRSARHCSILVHIDQLMPVVLDPLAAKPNLVVEARRALKLGAESGVDHCSHGRLLEADRLGGAAGDDLVDGRMIFESREMLLPMHIVAHG